MKNKTLQPARIEESDLNTVKKAAEKKGVSLSEWIRYCVVRASKRVMGVK